MVWEELSEEYLVSHLPMDSCRVLNGSLSHSVFAYHVNLASNVTYILIHIVNREPQESDCWEE